MFRMCCSKSLMLVLALLLTAGCGGGGGTVPSPTATPPPHSGGTGSVALLVTDAPSAELERFLVTLGGFALCRDGEDCVELLGNDRRVDLLEYEGKYLLDSFSNEVPVGSYDSLRLTVTDPLVEPNPLRLEIVADTGSFTLYPEQPIVVREGETTVVEFDFDVASSFVLSVAGKPHFEVRPVLTSRVLAMGAALAELTGNLGELLQTPSQDAAVRLLQLQGGAGTLPLIADGEMHWGGTLAGYSWEELPAAVDVTVWGHFNRDGQLAVDFMVETGQPIITGVVESRLSADQWVVSSGDGRVFLSVEDDRVWAEDGTPVLVQAIQERDVIHGFGVTRQGDVDVDGELLPELRASVLQVENRVLFGTLESKVETVDGARLRVRTPEGTEGVTVDSSTLLQVRGAGSVNARFLTDGVRIKVELAWGGDDFSPSNRAASRILLEPTLVEGEVVVDNDDVWTLIDRRTTTPVVVGHDVTFGVLNEFNGEHLIEGVNKATILNLLRQGSVVRALGIQTADGVLHAQKAWVIRL